MRILFVSECYPDQGNPQYGIFIKQQAQALRELGHEVDVLIPALTGRDGKIQNRQSGIYDLSYRHIRYDLFPMRASPKAQESIYRLIAENRYNLVAVHITGDGILKMVVTACNSLKIPVVAHYHGLNVWEEHIAKHPYRQKLYAQRRCKILRKTQGVVGVSEKVNQIVRQKLNTVPVYTVYNGVDVGLFIRKSRNDNLFCVIGVGNLIEIKGFRYLLSAFAKLHDRLPESRLEIVGEGIERSMLETQAETLGIAPVVKFSGKLPYAQVADRMAQSDLFVLPSFYEALGCVYLEAMGCGLPTIGVQGMGIDEIIVHDENGLLTKPKDSDDLYEKMYQVATNPVLAEKLGRLGRETAEKYTWFASAQKLEAVYKEILAK